MPRSAASAPSITLHAPRAPDAPEVNAAIALGRAWRATLGFLPAGAYRDAAAHGTLLIARSGDEIAGYALYALTQRHIRLTHLCVRRDQRGRGIARTLVNAVSERHHDYPGILARCRDDYELGEMWISLGFSPLSEAPGRGVDPQPVVRWWRDHGQPNLFTRPADNVLVRASIDLNILRDLVDPTRREAAASLALIDDQFSDRVELVRTPALDAEINGLDGELRRACLAKAALMPSVHIDPARSATVAREIATAVRGRLRGRYKRDEKDLRYVSDSVVAGLRIFVTRDTPLAELVGAHVTERFGLRLFQPADVLLHLDELQRAEAYRPVLLQYTRYRQQLIGTGQADALLRLVNVEQEEAPRAFMKVLRELAAAHKDRIGIWSPDDELVAAYSAHLDGATLTVPLLRTASVAERDTIARQVLFLLRLQAQAAGASVLHITDSAMSSSAMIACVTDGLVSHASGKGYYGFTLRAAAAAGEIERIVWLAADAAGVPRPSSVPPDLAAIGAAELERRWWPVKITDSQLSTWIVPIRQAFSQELLGEPRGLFPRGDGLGLSREHIYYRSPLAATPRAPARILWYMSGSPSRGAAAPALIACSALDDVVVGTPAELFMRFQHLGVWHLEQIARSATSGTAQALRFSNTEIFAHPVSLSRLREIGRAHRVSLVPQAPRKIPPELFAILYREGTRGAG